MADPKNAENKTFPVKLLKNYRPVGAFMVEGEDDLREPTGEELAKVPAGVCIHLPIDEARGIIEKGIAKRNDPIS